MERSWCSFTLRVGLAKRSTSLRVNELRSFTALLSREVHLYSFRRITSYFRSRKKTISEPFLYWLFQDVERMTQVVCDHLFEEFDPGSE